MALASMTGFARQAGQSGAWTWAWEVKTVNAKGFDLRLRLPPGFDALEPAIRADVPKRISRGTCFASLSAQRAGSGTESPPAGSRIRPADGFHSHGPSRADILLYKGWRHL